jgi:hypothetical protein
MRNYCLLTKSYKYLIFGHRVRNPNITNVDSKVPVTGSVWIEYGPDGSPFKFDSYSLFYKSNSESIWHPIIQHATKEKRSDTLAVWDTKSLAPDNYILRLVLYHNFNDSMEAAYFGQMLPPISVKGYHLFRNRVPPISVKGYHLFRNSVPLISVKGYQC